MKSTRTLKAVRTLREDLRPYRTRSVRRTAELDERARPSSTTTAEPTGSPRTVGWSELRPGSGPACSDTWSRA